MIPTVQLEVVVSDTGIGMTEEERGRLFQKFSQANRTTYSRFGGSGLGLVICKKLIERMGGSISVKSEKSLGTTFSFNIILGFVSHHSGSPQATLNHEFIASQPSTAPSSASPTSNGRIGHILIVEDNTMNQRILGSYLKQKSHIFQIANNGEEAVQKYEQFQFDLIFMDVSFLIILNHLIFLFVRWISSYY